MARLTFESVRQPELPTSLKNDLRELERWLNDLQDRLAKMVVGEPLSTKQGEQGISPFGKHAHVHMSGGSGSDSLAPYSMKWERFHRFEGNDPNTAQVTIKAATGQSAVSPVVNLLRFEDENDVFIGGISPAGNWRLNTAGIAESSVPDNSKIIAIGSVTTPTTFPIGQVTLYDNAQIDNSTVLPEGTISFGGFFNTTNTNFTTWAAIRGRKQNVTTDRAGGVLIFHTRFDDGMTDEFPERMRLDADGDLGINTTDPQHKLHVTETSGSGQVVVATFRTDSDTRRPALQFSDSTVNRAILGYSTGDINVSRGKIVTSIAGWVGIGLADNDEAEATLEVAGNLGLDEQAGDPTNRADLGQLYTKEVSTITELFYIDDAGTVTQLTDNGSVAGLLWERDAVNGEIYPKTLTDEVGIGTADPAYRLHVLDDTSGTGQKVIATLRSDASTKRPALEMSDATTTRSVIGLSTGDVNVSRGLLAGSSAGWVGVGLSDSQEARAHLHVDGYLALENQVSDPSVEAFLGELYTKSSSGISELFYGDDNSSFLQMTLDGGIRGAFINSDVADGASKVAFDFDDHVSQTIGGFELRLKNSADNRTSLLLDRGTFFFGYEENAIAQVFGGHVLGFIQRTSTSDSSNVHSYGIAGIIRRDGTQAVSVSPMGIVGGVTMDGTNSWTGTSVIGVSGAATGATSAVGTGKAVAGVRGYLGGGGSSPVAYEKQIDGSLPNGTQIGGSWDLCGAVWGEYAVAAVLKGAPPTRPVVVAGVIADIQGWCNTSTGEQWGLYGRAPTYGTPTACVTSGFARIVFPARGTNQTHLWFSPKNAAAGGPTWSPSFGASGGVYFDDGTNNTVGLHEHDGTNWRKLLALPASPPTYTPTNVSTDRSYDANSTSVDELADVLGTLIADLQAQNILA